MWDDLRVSADMVRLSAALEGTAPQVKAYAWNRERGPSFSGLQGAVFSRGRDGRGLFQNAFFHVQLPHSYQLGTAIEPHVHVRLLPGDEARAGQKLLLELEYQWRNIGEPAAADTEIRSINYPVQEEDLSGDNLLISFGMLEKPEAGISSMLSCRFSRITIDPGWEDFWRPRGLSNDTFEGGLLFYEFDFHYQRDTLGSREIYTK